ncbi:hypothetical protein SAMN04488102_102175 [Alkalibacterium subtropicum]|uniref:Lipoprotein n=1 Tax=Alkalibacterium subtropicum TaxID=753702 RepID=A0A1I1FMX7_9LACT|nr:hypothetical protein [Alkalibacterium subtropicum]SFC00684.1 hypothetical protein SAMN04488102_102175 [Alkalibacterium subtropicum]
MLRKKWIFYLPILLIVYISGCSNSNTNTNPYTGDALRISIIGDIPDVSEDNISFSTVTFDDLADENNAMNVQGDALFIMPENLVEASDDKYVNAYEKLGIPVFFIGTTKAHSPFVFKGPTYQNVADVYPKSYAAGYLYHSVNDYGEHWIFEGGEEGEELTENEIKNIYSDIFRTISNINVNY